MRVGCDGSGERFWILSIYVVTLTRLAFPYKLLLWRKAIRCTPERRGIKVELAGRQVEIARPFKNYFKTLFKTPLSNLLYLGFLFIYNLRYLFLFFKLVLYSFTKL